DIEAGRREEVIQFVYSRYGRHHAAQVANVISYRPRSAVRDVARALGYDPGQQAAWAKGIEQCGPLIPESRPDTPTTSGSARAWLGRGPPRTPTDSAKEAAAGHTEGIPSHVLTLAQQLLRLPRHLGIHSGGTVLCGRPVIAVVPVQWATTPGRTV